MTEIKPPAANRGPMSRLDRKIIAAHRATLTNDAVIDALDRLLDLVDADKEALSDSYSRTVHDLRRAEDRLAALEAVELRHGCEHDWRVNPHELLLSSPPRQVLVCARCSAQSSRIVP